MPEGRQQSTLSNFKKLSQAKEGPWDPRAPHSDPGSTYGNRDRNNNVGSLNPSQGSDRTPLNLKKDTQSATEDAVDTVVNDALEMYRSPWLVNILKGKSSPSVSAIKFDSPLFLLPPDGLLPAEIVAHVDACSPSTSAASISAFLHVDTGATCFVTNQRNELHCTVRSLLVPPTELLKLVPERQSMLLAL